MIKSLENGDNIYLNCNKQQKNQILEEKEHCVQKKE